MPLPAKMRSPTPLLAFAFALTLLLIAQRSAAFDVPPLQGPVNDYASLLQPDAKGRLAAELSSFEQRTGHQLAVLTVESLGGLTVEDYSMRVVEAWRLGRADADDGLLLLIARRDRKIRIEVGHGLEGVVPDAIAARVIREIAVPAFRQGEMSQGIEATMKAIMVACDNGGILPPAPRDERLPRLMEQTTRVLVGIIAILAIAPFILFPLGFAWALYRHLRGDRLPSGSSSSSQSSRTTSQSSSSSSSGSTSSSSSSSSSYSGGGGSFGGGGASGSW